MKPQILIAAAAVLGLALWLGSGLLVSEQSRVSKQLDALAEAVSKTKKESILVTAVEARKAADFFTDDLVLRPGAPFGELRDKEALTQQLAQLRHMMGTLKVRVVGQDITIDGRQAQVECTLRASYQTGEGPGNELREFRLQMVKQGGDWLIRELDVVTGL